jgi:hypothetical protein
LDNLSRFPLPKRTFVEAFRVVVWQYLNYQTLLLDISPEYDECPTICFKRILDNGNFCDGCEVKIAKDIFKEESIEELDRRLGKNWVKYDFDYILNTVINITAIEDDDRSDWSIVTETLFNVYLSQRNRLKRVDDWNFKQRMKNKET